MAKATPEPGMSASGNDGWINKKCFSIDGFIRDLFEAFVVGTPAYGLSAKGRDLFVQFDMTTPYEFKKMWDGLRAGIIECFTGTTRKEVKDQIKGSAVLNFNHAPTVLSEAMAIFIGNKYQDDELYKAYFTSATACSTKGKSKQEIQKDSEEKWSVAYVDKLFRHIRNSLAHGRFLVLNNEEGQEFIIFEDVFQNEITARILITRSRVEKWMKLFEIQEGIS